MSLRTPAERHAWAQAEAKAGHTFLGECLVASREAANIPAEFPDAADGWKGTKDRIAGQKWDASIPDGAFLWYSGGSAGHGHVCWKYGEKNGEPLVWTNQDVARTGRVTGGLRWVRLSTMESWYPNLKRAGISYDCDGETPPGVKPEKAAEPAPAVEAPEPVVEAPAPVVAPALSQKTVTVKAGDTLSQLAEKFGTTVGALVRLNAAIDDPDDISVGQVIKLK